MAALPSSCFRPLVAALMRDFEAEARQLLLAQMLTRPRYCASFPTRRVYFCLPKWYIAHMPGTGHRGHASPSFYAPSLRLKRLAYSCYGVGHTAWRQPGDMRGTVVGRHGRFKATPSIEEVMLIT